MKVIILVWSIFLGFTIGSFLNVCIYRLPKGISIVFPGSLCTKCKNSIAWYDNIPILSYLILRGKCRKCENKISIRYVLVELFSGLITGAVIQYFYFAGNKPLETVIVYILLLYLLIVITFIDLEYLIIPNTLTYPGISIVLILSVIFPGIFCNKDLFFTSTIASEISRLDSILLTLLGVIVSGGIVFITAIIGRLIFKKDAMGIGDVKLMGLAGGIIGWKLGIVVFFIAPFFGLCMAIPMSLRKNVRLIPYAPFLSVSILIVLFFQNYFIEIIDNYIFVIKSLNLF